MRSLPVFMFLLAACGGSEPEKPKHAPKPAPAAAEKKAPAKKAPAAAAVSKDADISKMDAKAKHDFLMKLGEKIYTSGDGGIACQTCHQQNGKGLPGAFPPLAGQKEWMGSCVHHAGIVVHGLSGEIEVAGTKFNGVMTPQGEMLNDLQIAAATTYVRNSWGNSYGDCTPADAKKARSEPPPKGPEK